MGTRYDHGGTSCRFVIWGLELDEGEDGSNRAWLPDSTLLIAYTI